MLERGRCSEEKEEQRRRLGRELSLPQGSGMASVRWGGLSEGAGSEDVSHGP